MLDAQYLAGLDFITVQQGKGSSYEDFLNSVSYAGRWASERGVSTPIMPIIRPQKDVESASLLLSNLVDRGFKGASDIKWVSFRFSINSENSWVSNTIRITISVDKLESCIL